MCFDSTKFTFLGKQLLSIKHHPCHSKYFLEYYGIAPTWWLQLPFHLTWSKSQVIETEGLFSCISENFTDLICIWYFFPVGSMVTLSLQILHFLVLNNHKTPHVSLWNFDLCLLMKYAMKFCFVLVYS